MQPKLLHVSINYNIFWEFEGKKLWKYEQGNKNQKKYKLSKTKPKLLTKEYVFDRSYIW